MRLRRVRVVVQMEFTAMSDRPLSDIEDGWKHTLPLTFEDQQDSGWTIRTLLVEAAPEPAP
jgi:hypothetical protein